MIYRKFQDMQLSGLVEFMPPCLDLNVMLTNAKYHIK